MMAQKHLDFRKALTDPRTEFGTPERLLADPRLDREGKRAILRSWEQDERELTVAEEEGMAGGEQDMFQRVISALDSISDTAANRTATTTKHGGRVIGPRRQSGGKQAARLVKDLMRSIDEVVHIDQNLHDAHVRMRHFQTTFLPVVDGEEIVGTLTARNTYGEPRDARPNAGTAKVRDQLSSEIAFCYEDDDLETAKAVIQESGHHQLLVTDDEQQLVGLITLERITAALRQHGARRPPAAKPDTRGRFAKMRSRATGARPGTIEVYAVRPKIKR